LAGSSGLRDGWQRTAVLLVVGGALYANALGNELVWDDRLTAAAPGGSGVFTRTGPYYRPLVMLSFALDRTVFGASAAAFHATNVLLHLTVAWLVGALVAALGAGRGVALASALVFVAHPVQTEAVSYVSGRTDVLCALFVLLALLAWRRAREPADRFALAATAAVVAALLSKEAAVAIPAVLLLPSAHPAARPPRPFLPLAAAVLWLAAWGASGGPGLHLAGLGARLPAIGMAALGYLRLLVWPVDLHLERFTAVPGWSMGATLAAWAAVGLAVTALVAAGRQTPGGLFLLALATLAYAPAAGIVPVYPAIAERALFTAEHFLYLPLLGLAPLVTMFVARTWPAYAHGARPFVLAAILLLWGVVVVDRNRDWRDEETLFRHTVAYQPPAARVWFNLGNLALAAGRLDEAERLYAAALTREPGDAAAWLNRGIAHQRAARRIEAEDCYRRALAADPALTEASRALAALAAARVR
jgi:hypothetical protein